MVITVFYNSQSEANNTSKILNRIILEHNDSHIREEVINFSVYIHHNPIKFTVLEMYNLDFGFLNSMASTIVTYLLILVQFKSQDQSDGDWAIVRTLTRVGKDRIGDDSPESDIDYEY